MALILATALVAIIALALPNPPNTLSPHDYPKAKGYLTGNQYNHNLTFTIYAEKKCTGNPQMTYSGQYGYYDAFQMQSYHLSRTLSKSEVLDFYSGSQTDLEVNHTIDYTLDGRYAEACWLYDATAGLNATTGDREFEENQEYQEKQKHHGRHEGCHTLVANEWCAVIWHSNNDPSS